MNKRRLLVNALALAALLLLSCSGIDPLAGFDLGGNGEPDTVTITSAPVR